MVFAPDAGEYVGSLIANPPPGAAVPPILPPGDGFLMLDKARFAKSFAADDLQAVADIIQEAASGEKKG